MQYSVRSKLLVIVKTTLLVVALAGCSFDVSAIPPARERSPQAGSPKHDSGSAEPMGSAGTQSEPITDAGGSQPPDAPMMEPVPPMDEPDARIAEPPPEPAPDAGMDAAQDANVEPEEDASVPEPDACDPALPCACPHLTTQAVPGGPCICSVAECAPDDDCRLLTRGSTRYYFCDNERTWDQANERCFSVPGLHLASVESAGEDAFILANVSDKTWLGGNDKANEGRWYWLGGDAFYDEDQGGALDNAYVNWHSSEPNNDGLSDSPADCMILWYENEAWADASCGDLHGYVCEVAP